MGLELPKCLLGIIDQSEARRFPTTVLCPESKYRDLVLAHFVHLGQLVAEFVFAHICAVWVEDVTGGLKDSKSV